MKRTWWTIIKNDLLNVWKYDLKWFTIHLVPHFSPLFTFWQICILKILASPATGRFQTHSSYNHLHYEPFASVESVFHWLVLKQWLLCALINLWDVASGTNHVPIVFCLQLYFQSQQLHCTSLFQSFIKSQQESFITRLTMKPRQFTAKQKCISVTSGAH